MREDRDDFRLRRGALRHWKFRALRKRLGAEAVVALLELWDFAAGNRWDGDLSGMTDRAIEQAAFWEGRPGSLVRVLVDLALLDGPLQGRRIHAWAEHQPWVANRETRVAAARVAGKASAAKRTVQQERSAPTCNHDAAESPPEARNSGPGQRTVQRTVNGASTPSPSPSPESDQRTPEGAPPAPSPRPDRTGAAVEVRLRDLSPSPPGVGPRPDGRARALLPAASYAGRLPPRARDDLWDRFPSGCTPGELLEWLDPDRFEALATACRHALLNGRPRSEVGYLRSALADRINEALGAAQDHDQARRHARRQEDPC